MYSQATVRYLRWCERCFTGTSVTEKVSLGTFGGLKGSRRVPLTPQEDCEQGKQRLSLAGKDPSPWCAWLHQEPEGIKREALLSSKRSEVHADMHE